MRPVPGRMVRGATPPSASSSVSQRLEMGRRGEEEKKGRREERKSSRRDDETKSRRKRFNDDKRVEMLTSPQCEGVRCQATEMYEEFNYIVNISPGDERCVVVGMVRSIQEVGEEVTLPARVTAEKAEEEKTHSM